MHKILLALALLAAPSDVTYKGKLSLKGQVTTPLFSNVVTANASTINFANGPSQTLSLGAATGSVTVTLSGFNAGDTLSLSILQHASAPQNITSWVVGGTKAWWPGGTTPTITATNSAHDEVACKVFSSTVIHCVVNQNFQVGS